MNLRHWLLLVVLGGAAALGAAVLARRLGETFTTWGPRFSRQRRAMVGFGILLFLVEVAVAAPAVAPTGPSRQLDIVGLQHRPPSARHPLGTDLYSRDVLSRVVYGARISLGVGALGAGVAILMGGLVGTMAGMGHRLLDALLMRLVDVGLAVPHIFIVFVAIAIGRQLGAIALAMLLGLTGWFGTSRLIRAEVTVLRNHGYVEAARALGSGRWRLWGQHLLPNVSGTLAAAAALSFANIMLVEAALSFLGAGIKAPTPSWGNMIADGRDYLGVAPWASLAPGALITITVVALHLVADGIRNALDSSTE